ncbi:MAG TPA: M15 family metallopeptidase [Acidimicrobiales bacterium]|nr:M15 family metallopeptidase [Acidimicrobiales bacterium]
MKRMVVIIGSALAGGLLGGGVMVAIQSAGPHPADPTPPRRASAERAATTLTTPTTRPLQSPPTTDQPPAPVPSVLLAWSRSGAGRGLDPGLEPAAAAFSSVGATSLVRAGGVDLVGSRDMEGARVDALAPGWAIPLDAAAVDPARHADFVPIADRAAIAGLRPGEAVLGRTSADLRRLAVGGVIELTAGQAVVVSAIVEDASIGGAELAVDIPTGERLGLTTPRYLLVAYRGDRPGLEDHLRAALRPGTVARFRGPGETPYLRHADAVLPQAQIKARFGEFSYRAGAGGGFEQDPAWQAENIVTRQVPILGTVRCHRGIVDALVGALTEIEKVGLAGLVQQAGYDGCFNARFVAGSDSVSRHAWGAAFDMGFSSNPTGLESVQDPRLVEIFRRWGFTSGDSWLIPDAGHFEYVAPPGS